jgi:hypothetical protein
MKALISRDSHRPGQRYSGVYHVQGAMITDADLDEGSAITTDLTDNLGDDSIRDGVPAKGGAVTIAADGRASLVEGIVYADGVRGVLRAAKDASWTGPLGIFTEQADLPLGPALPAGGNFFIYADLWERPVFPLEDPYLADAGLHGAVTGFRTRTMTQLKAAPLTAVDDIEGGTGAFPRIGTARLEVTPLSAEILADECDPCADVVTAEQQVANALWRLEVIWIDGPPNAPTGIALAWSEENAAEIARAGVSPETFERVDKVYEYFSPITEARAGVYANPADARRPTFVADLATAPTPNQDHDGQPWPFVRRWDGMATIDPLTNQVVRKMGAGFGLSMSGGTITLRLAAFEVAIDLNGAAVVPGDYWLVELRRYATEAERIRLVQETPIGILHHYCTLFTVSIDGIEPLSDAQRRKLSFPPLSNLPADHIGLINNCEKLYGDAENVQDALDNLCSISAEDIAFDPAHCPTLYDNSQTVQQALDSLCRIDFSVQESFRLLFDWGVVCGIVPKLLKPNSGEIEISAGSFLDRSGRVVKFPGGKFDLAKELDIGSGIEFESPDAFRDALSKGEVCLALAAAEGGKTSLHLVPTAIAFGPPDPSFSERLRKCVEARRFVPVPDLLANLPRRQVEVANKLFLASSAEGAFLGSARLNSTEFADAEAFSGRLVQAYASVASQEETALLTRRFEEARLANPIGTAAGPTRDIRHMQQASAVLTAFRETDQERLQRCTCELLLPPCPPELGPPPFYVPIACLRGDYERPRIFLEGLCAYCCRKQAMTWRSLQYFIGDIRTRMAKEFADICCPKEDRTPRPGPVYHPERLDRLNFVGFVEDYKLVNTFLDRPETLPTDFVTRLDVNNLRVADAVREIRGRGLEVVETVDVGDPRAFAILQDRLTGIAPQELPMSRAEVRPGDKVALLAQDGIARSYVLVEQGPGKLPFETGATSGIGEDEVKRVDELVRTVKKDFDSLRKAGDDALSAAGRIRTETGDLASGIERLGTQASELLKQRDAIAEAVAAAGRQIGDLVKTRETLSGEIAAATRELADIQTHHKALLNEMREAQPINVVLGNNMKVLAELAGEGLTTVGDIARLTPALIKKLDRAGILKAEAATVMKDAAAAFLKRS